MRGDKHLEQVVQAHKNRSCDDKNPEYPSDLVRNKLRSPEITDFQAKVRQKDQSAYQTQSVQNALFGLIRM
jgi:hypothetical protein